MVHVRLVCIACALVWGVSTMIPAHAEERTIVDEWNSAEVPPAPKLEAVTLDPKNSAILVLDILHQNCTTARRPRCAASVPRIQRLLDKGRSKAVMVTYSIFPRATATDILAEVAPRAGEPVVTAGPDKFLCT